MPTDTRTPKHRLIDHLMVAKTGADLRSYVKACRAEDMSWRKIASLVSNLTGEDTANVTLMEWLADDIDGDRS